MIIATDMPVASEFANVHTLTTDSPEVAGVMPQPLAKKASNFTLAHLKRFYAGDNIPLQSRTNFLDCLMYR